MKTIMKSMHLVRLKRLATYLEIGKLAHARWDINIFNETPDPKEKMLPGEYYKPSDANYTNGIALVGNAIGECPCVFGEWYFAKQVNQKGVFYLPLLKGMPAMLPKAEVESALRFFQLTQDEYNHLFVPGKQFTTDFGGERLNSLSSAKDVAVNIFDFINVKSIKIGYESVTRSHESN